MVNILTSLNRTLIAGSILTILFVLYYISVDGLIDEYFWQFIFRKMYWCVKFLKKIQCAHKVLV